MLTLEGLLGSADYLPRRVAAEATSGVLGLAVGTLVQAPAANNVLILDTYDLTPTPQDIQWSPSIVDTLGTWPSVLYRQVPHFKIEKAYLRHRKVSIIQRCLYFSGVLKRGFLLHTVFTAFKTLHV